MADQPPQTPPPPDMTVPVPPPASGGGGRISRGFRLARVSWDVVRSEKELLALPLISVLCTIVIMGLMTGIAYGVGGLKSAGSTRGVPPVDYPIIAVAYLLIYFVGIYFNAAIIGIATLKLEGKDPVIGDGFRLATSKLGKILGWALIAATVGLILQWLDERAGAIGKIGVAILGAAWNIVTFFVIPVILYEPTGVIAAMKRSAHIVKERWGEQIVGNAAIGIAVFLVAIPVLILCGLVTAVLPPVGIVLMVIAIALLIGIGGALSGVFNAALYQFATTGRAGGGFSEGDLNSAFRPSKRRGFLGR